MQQEKLFLFHPLIIILFCFIRKIDCCTPANREAQVRLRQYLGVEADPTALDKTGYSDNYIKKSSDLDCNFEGLCRWKNVPTDNVSDFFDYYYFTRTDNKPWPTVIKPGNTPDVGNHFILSGGKDYDPQQDAIWISTPIQCQKNIGSLSFTYWMYNDGKLQAVLYKAKSNPLQKLSSPTLFPPDCTANNGKRGSPCVFTIPPVKEPFQIGIRNYNYKREGFGAIDDIKYIADVCSAGSSLKFSSFGDSLTGNLINDTSQVQCSSWDKSCRWGNAPTNVLNWQQANGDMEDSMWRDSSRSNQSPPTTPFAIVQTDRANPSGSAIMYSDPIQCQSSDGTLTLKYWTAGSTQLQVCQLDAQTNAEVKPCQSLDKSSSPGPARVLVKGPISQPFRIAIKASNFTNDQGNAAAVNDVTYDAKMCPSGVQSTAFQRFTNSTDFAKDSREADCNFDTLCQWYNIDGDDFDWELTKNQPDASSWQKTIGTSTTPVGGFATIPNKIMNRVGTGYLVSKPFGCQKDTGTVTVNYWTSQSAAMDLCVFKKGTTTPIYCGDTMHGGPGPQTIQIPGPINELYQLGFKGVSIDNNPNLVAVDNIAYRANVCSDNGLADAEACKSLNCDFTTGQPCNWNINNNMPPENEKFSFFNSSLGIAGNVQVKPTQNGQQFLGVTIKDPSKPMAYIESPNFKVSQNRKLKVAFKRGTFGSTLYVCRNHYDTGFNSMDCHAIAGPDLTLDEYRGKAAALVDISANEDHKVYIIARQSDFKHGPASFGLDNIQLLDLNGNLICPST